ncbi:MAG TPA: hypothetical protein VFZ73_13645 [Gemmatimonadaceae bacterium]
MSSHFPERRDSLWMLAAGPSVWAAHLMVSYVTAAVWCAKYAGEAGTLGAVRSVIVVYSAVALVAIAIAGWSGLQRHRHGDGTALPHDSDTPGDRHRFLGFATFLLAGLSAVAVFFQTLPAVVFGTCQ